MLESLLSSGVFRGEEDDSTLPFPLGTPFKGVTRSKNFITGPQLATAIGLTAGTPINDESGWLHYINSAGLEFYIAKKALRCNLTWEVINEAQNSDAKEVSIGGEVYICRFIRGLKPKTTVITPANAGGDWNDYIYPIYGGTRRNELPTDTPVWGSYNAKMLGLPEEKVSQQPGGLSICKEGDAGSGYTTRGVTWTGSTLPNIMGTWYIAPNTPQPWYGWRPILVRKSSIPVAPPSPFKGLVPSDSFITPSDLSTLCGYTTGTLIASSTPWMHFVEDSGKELYIAQRSLRDRCSRGSLNTAGLGNTAEGKLVTIGGKNYRCRLLTNAEWNRYMYNVYSGAIVVASEGWAEFDDVTLGTCVGGVVPGGLTHIYDGATRGYENITGTWATNEGAPNTSGYGWRPVLEYIGPA